MTWAERSDAALNRLAKWRTVLAGWQLGTRPKGDAECDAVRDQRELLLALRVELTALTHLCLRAKICTLDEYHQQIVKEALQLETALEHRFPGFKATGEGIEIDTLQAAKTMAGWRP